jgi:Zn-dependent M28 family amino/carboxypeptidase
MQLILVAHYDSKSQRLPLILRIALFVVGIGGSLVFAVSILFSSFYAPLAAIGILAGGLSLLADLPLLFLDRGNASSGAIDDASGLGVVLHLAEVLAAQPDIAHQVGLSVLITSAEEFGTLGATAFVRQNSEQLHLQDRDSRLYVLNFDGPGVDGKLYWVGGDRPGKQASEPCLSFLVPQACAELDYHLGKFSLPGALFDHLPFTHHGFDAGSLISIGRASLSIHTSRDSVDQLHIRGFEQAGRVALQIIGKLQTPSKVE